MVALFTALAVLAPLATVFAAAAHSPRDAAGNPVPRSSRTFTGDLRSLVS